MSSPLKSTKEHKKTCFLGEIVPRVGDVQAYQGYYARSMQKLKQCVLKKAKQLPDVRNNRILFNTKLTG